MELNEFTLIDYIEQARSRYTSQFKNKPVFDKHMQVWLNPTQELQEVFKDLMQNRSIDSAVGVQLDLIGALVGQTRVSIPSNAVSFFGFQGAIGALGFGSSDDASVGGLLSSITNGEGNIALSDDIYRLFIKAKILYNSTSATPEQTIANLKFLIGSDFGSITEQPNAHVTLNFGSPLDQIEQYVIKGVNTGISLIPLPAGVAVDYVSYNGEQFFGFQGVRGAQGMGDENDLSGGILATVF